MNLSSYILKKYSSGHTSTKSEDVTTSKKKNTKRLSPKKVDFSGHRLRMRSELLEFFEELSKNRNSKNEVNVSVESIGRSLKLGSGASQYRARLLRKYNIIEFFVGDETPPHARSIRILNDNFNFEELKLRGR